MADEQKPTIQPLMYVAPTSVATAISPAKLQIMDENLGLIFVDRVILQVEADIGSLHFFFDADHAKSMATAFLNATQGMKKDGKASPPSGLEVVQDIPDALKRRNHQ
jgi:hypothetical protein